jgi:hypothetical protein
MVQVLGRMEIWTVFQDENILNIFHKRIIRKENFYITWNGRTINKRKTFNKEYKDSLFMINIR